MTRWRTGMHPSGCVSGSLLFRSSPVLSHPASKTVRTSPYPVFPSGRPDSLTPVPHNPTTVRPFPRPQTPSVGVRPHRREFGPVRVTTGIARLGSRRSLSSTRGWFRILGPVAPRRSGALLSSLGLDREHVLRPSRVEAAVSLSEESTGV